MKYKKEGHYIKFESIEDMPPMAVSFASTLYNKTGSWRSELPIIDYDKCILCMLCWKFCPDAAIDIIDDKPVINYDYCKGCGICAEECPKEGALYMVEEKK